MFVSLVGLRYMISRLPAIMAIPAITPPIAMWCLPYFSAVGSSSSSEMYTMMPATAERMSGNAMLLPVNSMPNSLVRPMQISAPSSSLNPDNVA